MSYEEQLHANGKCAEIVMIWTEDGQVDGRCRRTVVSQEEPMCDMHLAEFKAWREMNEFEKAAWEYNMEMGDSRF